MRMTVEQALQGMMDAEEKLSTRRAVSDPAYISEQMFRLGQYASALEQFLGDAEEEYETEWAEKYKSHLSKPLSATAAKQQADMDMAAMKGNIKKLQRYVSAAWHVHMSCMARHKHLASEMKGSI